MKKKMNYILILLCLILGITACSPNKNEEQVKVDKSEIDGYEKEISELKEEVKTLTSQLRDYEEVYGTLDLKEDLKDEASDKAEGEETTSRIKEIKIGELISIEDYCEFTVSQADFTQRVNPTNPDSYYSYYEVKDPKDIFLDTIIEFKNNSTISLDPSEVIDVKVLYDNKYNYTSFTVAEKSGGGDMETFAKVDPLSHAKTHSIAEMPIEVRDSGKEVAITISIYGNIYKLKVKS